MPPMIRAMTNSSWTSAKPCTSAPTRNRTRGEHHHVAPAHQVGQATGEEGADEAADQQRSDGEAEPGVAEVEGVPQPLLGAVHRAAVIAEQKAADRRHGDDRADISHVRPLRDLPPSYRLSLDSTGGCPVSGNTLLEAVQSAGHRPRRATASRRSLRAPSAGPTESRMISSWDSTRSVNLRATAPRRREGRRQAARAPLRPSRRSAADRGQLGPDGGRQSGIVEADDAEVVAERASRGDGRR